jgi:hypothetical protein
MDQQQQPGFFRRHATRLAAATLIATLYGFARQPTLPESERRDLASRFAFVREPFATPPGDLRRAARRVRQVHPALRHIQAWVSAVGAAVALNDLDGDGLPNDLCTVDPRVDQALVEPAPGTGARYPLFALDPAPLPYDPRTMAPMGCLPVDLNEDGRMDLVVYYWGRTPVAFLRRAGTSALSAAAFRPVELVPGGGIWNTNAMTSADVDGDGHLDLIVGNYFPDGMAMLDTRSAGPAHMHHSMSRSENGGRNRLLLWKGGTAGPEPAVEFTDVPGAFDPQTTYSWTLAVGAADLDGDLLPEIYFANDFGSDRLLRNLSTPGHPRFAAVEGRRTFTTPASKVLGRDSFKGMGLDFADLNGDGVPDLYVSNIAQPYALEENHFVWVSTGDATTALRRGIAPYTDRGEELGLARSGWAWDARFADFDDDGVPEAIQAVGFARGETNRWPELHELALGNDNDMARPGAWPRLAAGDDLSGHLHNPFFVRARDGRYYDLARELGLDDSHVSRGIAIADVDGDGALDFALADQWEPSYLFHNVGPRRGSWLEIEARLPAAVPGETGTRPAIGAEATVWLPDGRRMSAQVDGGTGHSGKRAPELHFGLGRIPAGIPAGTPLRVDLRWRDGNGRARAGTFRLAPGRHVLNLATGKEG